MLLRYYAATSASGSTEQVDERAVSWQLFYGGRTDKDCLEIHEQMIGVVKLKQPDPLDENAKAQGFCHAFAR